MSSALGITEGLVKGTGSGSDQPGPRKAWSRHVPSFSFSNDQECDETLATSCGRRKIAHTSIGGINDVGLN